MEKMTYAFIYDRDLVEEDGAVFEDKKTDKKCSKDEVRTIMKRCVSVNFYGEDAVERGVKDGYVHPDSVGEVKGVPTAMYMRL